MKYEYKAIPTLVNLPALERGVIWEIWCLEMGMNF